MGERKGTTTLEYDYENRLTKFTKPDNTWVKFTYDPFGRRYSKETSDGQKELYLYDGLHIIEVYDGNTMALKSSFVHSDIIDEVLYGNIQGQDVYYHQDGLNSVKALTDAGGNIITNYDYDAWGNPFTMASLVANPFTYTGREYDKETGLYYYRARYYDARIGRFISEDPILTPGNPNVPFLLPGLLKTPAMLHAYNYVGNNPVNWIDPLGLQKQGCCNQDFLTCLAKCIEQNDPLNLIGKGALTASGGTFPKSWVGLPRALGSGPVTTVPSVSVLGSGAAGTAVRTIGRIYSPIWIGYGLYLAGMESWCTGACLGDKCAF